MTTEISRSSRLIGACLRALALDHRARLDQASMALLERARHEAEATTAHLRSRGSSRADEALNHVVVVTACIGSLLEEGAFMDIEARRRVVDEAIARLHQFDELVDTLG
jgi:hypothetical protein